MALYFVAFTDANGENLDLFVRGQTVPEVIAAWRTHYELDEEEAPDEAVRVFRAPAPDGAPGAIDWAHIPNLNARKPSS